MKLLSRDFLPEKAAPPASTPYRGPTTLATISDRVVTCDACSRLRSYCARVAREKKRAHREDTYWGRPVPGFGDPTARVLLLGLAPAAHGANRTGRPFTGDGKGGSAEFLVAALHRAGLANQPTSERVGDGLVLKDAYVAMAVRCAPPDNRPTPEELARCLPHLEAEVACLPRLKVVLALGAVAFDAWLRLLRRRGRRVAPRPAFGHGQVVEPGVDEATLVGCYHPSRQNTNTGRLTASMLDDVVQDAIRIARRP
jgi:uracil-DNA glycosylase family 4